MREVKLNVGKNKGALAELLDKLKASNEENNGKDDIYYELDLSDLNGIEDKNVIERDFLKIINYLKDNNLIAKNIDLTNTDLGAAHTDFAKMIYGVNRYKKLANLTGYSSGDENKNNVIKGKLAENRRELLNSASEQQVKQSSSSVVDIKEILDRENLSGIDGQVDNSNDGPAKPWSKVANEVVGLKDEIDALMDDLAADYKAGKFREEPKANANTQENVPANKELQTDPKVPANEALQKQADEDQSNQSDTPKPAK